MIDIAIVAFYMISVLGVGIIAGLKVKDLEDYSTAKGSYSSFVLMAAIFATLVGGGSTMGVSEKIFSTGLVFFLACICFVIRDLIIAFFLVPKFDQFRDCLTVGDIMAKYYGTTGKICVGVAGSLQCSMYLSMQLAAMGHLLNYFMGLPYWLGLVIGVGIVIIYSSFGGIRAVTITDVIQFSVLIVAIPVTFTIGLDMVGGFHGVFSSVPKHMLSFIPDTNDEVRFYSLLLVFVLPYLNPALVQRLLMGKTTSQVRTALIISALGRLPYYFMVGVLGLVAFILNPNLKADLAFPYIVHEILPTGIKGLVIAGIIAVIMSTADSFLHVAGLLLTHDVIKPLVGNKLNDAQEFKLARLLTALIGTIALIAALSNANLIELNILAYVFWLPAIFVPLVFGVLGGRAQVRTFLTSGGFGIATYIIWQFFLFRITHIDSLLPAVTVNALTFFTLVNLEKKKLGEQYKRNFWALIKGSINKWKSQLILIKKQKKLFLWRHVFKLLLEQSTKRVEIFGAPYGLFVLFAVANFCFMPLIFSNVSGQTTPVFIIYLRVFTSTLSFVLIIRDFWPKRLTPYLPLYWHFTLFFCLPFFTMSMCLFSSCAIEWVIDLVLTNFILGLLVDWKTYSISIIMSAILASLAFLLCGDIQQFDPNLGNFPIMTYATCVSMIAGALFSRNKERVILEKFKTLEAISQTIAHEMRTPLSSINLSANGLQEIVPKLVQSYSQAQSSGIIVPKISQINLDSLINAPERMGYICANTLRVIDVLLLQLKDKEWNTNFEKCSLSSCLEAALDEYSFKEHERKLIDSKDVRDFEFIGNSRLVVHIIFNLLANALTFIRSEKKGEIRFWTSKIGNENRFHVYDNAKGISPDDMPYIFDHGFSKRNSGSGVGLYYCKKMMETMAGTISVKSKEGDFTEFVLSFPPIKNSYVNDSRDVSSLVGPDSTTTSLGLTK